MADLLQPCRRFDAAKHKNLRHEYSRSPSVRVPQLLAAASADAEALAREPAGLRAGVLELRGRTGPNHHTLIVSEAAAVPERGTGKTRLATMLINAECEAVDDPFSLERNCGSTWRPAIELGRL